MVHIVFDSGEDNLVTPEYSAGKGPVLRSDTIEVTRISFRRVHSTEALEDTTSLGRVGRPPASEVYQDALCFKRLVDPPYEATGRLDGPSDGTA